MEKDQKIFKTKWKINLYVQARKSFSLNLENRFVVNDMRKLNCCKRLIYKNNDFANSPKFRNIRNTEKRRKLRYTSLYDK